MEERPIQQTDYIGDVPLYQKKQVVYPTENTDKTENVDWNRAIQAATDALD